MHIVGFAGKSGSGKTEAAMILSGLLIRMGYSVKLDTFAAPVRRDAIAHFGALDADSLEQRAWMQRKAGEIRGRSPRYFVNQFILRNNLDVMKWEPADFLIVHDLRMPDEVDYCWRHGVVVFMQGVHRPLPEALAGDWTETAIDGLFHKASHIIKQQPDLKCLAKEVRKILETVCHIRKQGAGEPTAKKGQ